MIIDETKQRYIVISISKNKKGMLFYHVKSKITSNYHKILINYLHKV